MQEFSTASLTLFVHYSSQCGTNQKHQQQIGIYCFWSDLSESSADCRAARSFVSRSVCDRAE